VRQPHNYDELRNTQEQVDRKLAAQEAQAQTAQKEPEFLTEEDKIDLRRDAFAEHLQDRVSKNLITESDKARELEKLELGDPDTIGKAEKAQQLKEDQQIVRDARAREVLEQNRHRENGREK
jgi:hypothetical protein